MKPLHQEVTVTLTVAEVISIARTVRNRLRKEERRLAKSTFVPADGNGNAQERMVETLHRRLVHLLESVDMTPADLEDGGKPKRRPVVSTEHPDYTPRVVTWNTDLTAAAVRNLNEVLERDVNTCPVCHGKGVTPDGYQFRSPHECRTCYGTGKI